jgi:cytochrome P450
MTGMQPPTVRMRLRDYRAVFDRRRTPGMFARFAAQHPDVVEIKGIGQRLWLVSNATWAREVMVDNGRSVTKGVGMRLLRLVLGDGILTTEDAALHKRNRRLVNPAFAMSALTSYAEVMVAAAQRADERWQAGRVIEITDEMQQIALDIVGRTLLGDDTDQDAKAITDALEVVIKRFGLGFLPNPEKLLESRLPPAVKMRHAVEVMKATVERIVTDHQDKPDARQDAVGALIAANEDGETLSAQQVRDETLTLLLAGFETTANALAWTWWHLDQHPDVAATLRGELHGVLGDAAPTFDDIAKLPFTTAVIAETMRLRPPAWIMERAVREPIEFGGYRAEAGTTILMSPWIVHRDARNWGADVATFRPSRWVNADGAFDPAATGAPRGAYFPFGAGSRICIGENFAWNEAVLVLATLARRWAPVTEPHQEIGIWAAVTLRPHPDIKMRLQPVRERATAAP